MSDDKHPPSIKCPRCNMVSYHPKDIETGWCANCNEFTTLSGDDIANLMKHGESLSPDTDYVMNEGYGSGIWITAKRITIRLELYNGGRVKAELFITGKEDGEPLAVCEATPEPVSVERTPPPSASQP